VSPARTDDPMEMPIGGYARVGPRKHVLDGDQGRMNLFAAAIIIIIFLLYFYETAILLLLLLSKTYLFK